MIITIKILLIIGTIIFIGFIIDGLYEIRNINKKYLLEKKIIKNINDKYNIINPIMDSKTFMNLYKNKKFYKKIGENIKLSLNFDFFDESDSCQYIEYSYIVDGFKEIGGKFRRWDLDKLLYINGLIDINPKIIIDYINNDINNIYFNENLYFKLFDLLNIKNKQGLKKLKENIKKINEMLNNGENLINLKNKPLNNN